MLVSKKRSLYWKLFLILKISVSVIKMKHSLVFWTYLKQFFPPLILVQPLNRKINYSESSILLAGTSPADVSSPLCIVIWSLSWLCWNRVRWSASKISSIAKNKYLYSMKIGDLLESLLCPIWQQSSYALLLLLIGGVFSINQCRTKN